jgi:hypothetical protein
MPTDGRSVCHWAGWCRPRRPPLHTKPGPQRRPRTGLGGAHGLRAAQHQPGRPRLFLGGQLQREQAAAQLRCARARFAAGSLLGRLGAGVPGESQA